MKSAKFYLIMILLTGFIYGQDLSDISTTPTQNEDRVHFGLEVDALPFIFGGYYGSVWTSVDNFRFRAIVTQINQPDFVTQDGFEDLETNAYTFLVDYFPFVDNGDLSGLWIGAGAEYWDNSVVNSEDKVSGDFENYIFTLGAGYVIKIYKNLYINPWGAFHLRVAGDKEMQIGTKKYDCPLILPEVSVKLGWYF